MSLFNLRVGGMDLLSARAVRIAMAAAIALSLSATLQAEEEKRDPEPPEQTAFRNLKACMAHAGKENACQFFETTDQIFAGLNVSPLIAALEDSKALMGSGFMKLMPYADAAVPSAQFYDQTGKQLMKNIGLSLGRGTKNFAPCQKAVAVNCFSGLFIDYAFSGYGASWTGVGTVNTLAENRKGICADFALLSIILMREIGMDAEKKCNNKHCFIVVRLPEGEYYAEPQGGTGVNKFYAYVPEGSFQRCNSKPSSNNPVAQADACDGIADLHQEKKRSKLWVNAYREKAACLSGIRNSVPMTEPYPMMTEEVSLNPTNAPSVAKMQEYCHKMPRPPYSTW